MDNEKKKMNHDDLKQTTGGFPGEYAYISTYCCPRCGTPNTINQYCYSGQTTWNCVRGCGQFVISF